MQNIIYVTKKKIHRICKTKYYSPFFTVLMICTVTEVLSIRFWNMAIGIYYIRQH